jgi:hypothetical protein
MGEQQGKLFHIGLNCGRSHPFWQVAQWLGIT